MKRILCILLALIIMLPLSACGDNRKELRAPVNFYYRTREVEIGSEAGVISAEQRESFGHSDDYVYLTEIYLNGPTSGKCISPFPAGTTLEYLDFTQDKVLVELSSHISLLSGAELTIACVCLTKTLSELTGMKSVQITSKGDLLDGKESLTFSVNDFQLEDDTPDYASELQ